MIQQQAERTAGGKGPQAKELQAEMLQRYYGLQSMQQAAALMSVSQTMQPGDMKGLDSVLKRSGVQVKDFNATNIQTVAKIAGSTTADQLDDVYADLKTRTGTAALSEGDQDKIDEAKGKGFTQYQDALVKATATKDYAQDSYTIQQQMDTKLGDIKTAIGDTLLNGVTHLESSMITAMGGQEKFDKAKAADAEYQKTVVREAALAEHREILKHPLHYGNLGEKDIARLKVLNEEERTGEHAKIPDKALPGRGAAKHADGSTPGMLPEITVVANFEHHDEHGNVKKRTRHHKIAKPTAQPTPPP